ncbi:PDZ domain-containing protein 8-like isoform X1 [Daphnia carinata]|uniref:PDZ domain-containing protein 8-like isoform X1 n=1 Tax=Daphnia carinata TaxID=120202 RepID=UPI0025795638|nr:PDZ domain-containing protein 8-like isoform X1 [Daphnia carinata]
MVIWLIATAAVCILLGAILTLWVEWHLFSQPVRSHRLAHDDDEVRIEANNPIELPEELLAELEALVDRTSNADSVGSCNKDETLLAVNLLVQFFFRELRSQGPVRRFLLRRINQEMEEVLTRGAVSKIIKGLKIYDIEMGSRAPSIHQIGVHRVGMDDDRKQMESVDFDLTIDYSGGLGIAIDVTLAYGKSAFLSAKVSRLKGQVRLSFSRRPYSHWSVAFAMPPQLDVDVTSRVQGRSFSHVTSLVSSQIHKWIQRKYTLPSSRMRHRPFFPHPNQLLLPTSSSQTPPPPTTSPIRRGSLEVTALDIARLNPLLQGEGVYCTMALDSSPWLNASPSETEGRVVLDIRMIRRLHQSLGIQFQQQSSSPESSPLEETGKEWKPANHGAPVLEIESESVAEEAGLKIGDIILQVDETTVRSGEDVIKAVHKSSDLFVILRVDRLLARRRGSMMRFDTTTPSMTFDGFDEKSQASALAASLWDEAGSHLFLPTNNLPSINKLNQALDIKRTATRPLEKVIHLGDTLKFHVAPAGQHRFLNLSIWLTGVPAVDETTTGKNSSGKPSSSTTTSPSKSSVAKSNLSNLFKKHSPLHQVESKGSTGTKEQSKDVPIGYVNICLPEVAADCHLNTQGHHISTYQLYPADVKANLGRQSPSSHQLGFDPRLCYGDISLSFVYRPDKDEDLPSPDLDSDIVDGIPYPLSPLTHLTAHHLLSPLVEMARPAVDIMVNDSMPMHHFVLTQFINVRLCDFCRKKIWLREAFKCGNCELVCHKKCIKRFPDRKWCGIDDFFLPTMPIAIDTPKVDPEENPFLSTEEDVDELVELESAVDRLQSREHDESLMRLAKDSGKEIYSHLNSGQRRNRISSMLQRLESATEMEILRRYELAARLDRPDGTPWSGDEKQKLEKEAELCEARRQALVLLLLHYSAGLQNVEEAERDSKLGD